MLVHSLFRTSFSLCLATLVFAQTNWTTSPFNPFSLPLAVKSPYVNAWAPLGYNTTGSSALNGAIPRLWSNVLAAMGWDAAILVDGAAYQLLGVPPENTSLVNANQLSFFFTPTRSTYVLQAGPVDVTITFMSPVEAKDLVHQSMPFSYLYFEVNSTDGSAHDITIYSDVTGEWITGNNLLEARWKINESNDFVYLQMNLTSPDRYEEIDNRPQDATVYYCVEKTDGVSWQIGPADDIRAGFANGTKLNNQAEAGAHAVGFPFNTLSFSVDLGSISSTSEPVAFALGVVRDPVVQYANRLAQVEERSAYYWSQFANIHDTIADVVNRSADALSAAISLDTQILGDAEQISSNYGDLLSLSTRQVMSAFEYTLSRSNGALNTSDVKAFMKDMGGIGSGGVNAVDVLYSAMPVFLYLNPAILGYLLSPLLEQQEGSSYTNPYAAQDIGTRFPIATGNPLGHNQGIEHSASMLIMSLAHAQASGDGGLLAQHYGILRKWADYLVNNTMNPGYETTSMSDAIESTNQTNLVLKGIIGIGAMAKISEYGGYSDDQNKYDGIAKDYAQQWTSLASGTDQIALNFGSGSSGLVYNLYADKLLQLNLINSSVYSLQTSFYQQQTSLWKYGIPLDSSNTSSITRSDWMMFAASSVSDTSIRDSMISQVWEYAASNLEQNLPFPVSYDPDDPTSVSGENSPAQGAMFAPLALNVPIQSVNFSGGAVGGASVGGGGGSNNGSGDDEPSPSKSSNTGVIVGAAVGGLAGLGVIIGVLFFFLRRRQRKNRFNGGGPVKPMARRKVHFDSFIERPGSSIMVTEAAHIRAAPYQYRSRPNSSEICNPPSIAVKPQTAVRSSEYMAEGGPAKKNWGNRGVAVTPGAQSSVPRRHEVSRVGLQQSEILSEMDNIRREIARIRAERAMFGERLPPYEEQIAALTARASR